MNQAKDPQICRSENCSKAPLVKSSIDIQYHAGHKLVPLENFTNEIKGNNHLQTVIQNISLLLKMMEEMIKQVNDKVAQFKAKMLNELQLREAYEKLVEQKDFQNEKAEDYARNLKAALINPQILETRVQEREQLSFFDEQISGLFANNRPVAQNHGQIQNQRNNPLNRQVEEQKEVADNQKQLNEQFEISIETLKAVAKQYPEKSQFAGTALLIEEQLEHEERKHFVAGPKKKTTIYHVQVIDQNGQIQNKQFRHTSYSWIDNMQVLIPTINLHCKYVSGNDPDFKF